MRRPITLKLLQNLLKKLTELNLPFYEVLLFQSMFLLAFHFALRISEITSSAHNLSLAQISINNVQLTIHFSSYKHSPLYPDSHSLSGSNSPYCPIKILNQFLAARGNSPGPLFLIKGKAVSRPLFCSKLKIVLDLVGEQNAHFSSHSFRIGAATHWANEGKSDLQIRRLGRWRSDAMLRYIRGIVNHDSMVEPSAAK